MLSLLRVLGKSEHKRIQEQLSAYLDGELSARDRAAVERHLRTCGECAHDLDTLRWTVSLVQEVPAVTLPRSFTVRPAAVEAVRAPRRARLAYAYLRGATALATVLLALVLSGDVLSQVFTGAGPAPQMAEREIVVEKAVVQTVVVEKEVVAKKEVAVEKPVVETVVVEVEKVVEKAAVEEKAMTVTSPSAKRPLTAQGEAIGGEKPVLEAQPTPSPPFQIAERTLATEAVEKELKETDVGAERQGTPVPPAAAGVAPTKAEPTGTPTDEVADTYEPTATAVPTPTPVPTTVVLEPQAPSRETPLAERRAVSVPSGQGLSLWRQLEIGLLAAVIVLGAATLVARKRR